MFDRLCAQKIVCGSCNHSLNGFARCSFSSKLRKAAKIHVTDSQLVLQACIFEIVPRCFLKLTRREAASVAENNFSRTPKNPLTAPPRPLTYQLVCMAAKVPDKSVPETKRRLLDAALKLMLAKGFTATTVDEICSAARLTKGSFFHYFKTKEDIAKQTVTFFFERQKRMFDEAPFRKLDDPLDRVHGRLDLLTGCACSPDAPKSCLIGNLAQEVSGTHPEIRCLCDEAFVCSAKDFERDLAEAKKLHTPKAKFSPASVARLYIALIQGSMILAKASGSTDVFEENVEHLRCYIDSLFEKT
jgi:TetR/AcrR family transcriptional regulator, transcriptional repressor for nem operon